MRFDGETAVITGAANGIGLGCAEEFAAHGAHVALADLDDEKGRAEAARIAETYGVQTLFQRCDVANVEDVDALFAAVSAQFGAPSAVVANAGIVHGATILDLEPEDFDRVIAVNLRGVFLTGRAGAKAMVAAGRKGAIVNISSTSARVAIPNQVAYAASKGGVSQLTCAMALGLAEHGVRVNAIGPGSIETDVLRKVFADDSIRRMVMSRTPLGRIGEPREIGRVAVFLASDYASYMTGETVFADGGRLALNLTMPVRD